MNLDEWIQTVKAEEFPSPPFFINSGTKVLEVQPWLDYIKRDCPARVKTGAQHHSRIVAYSIWTEENIKRGKEIIF